MFKKKNYKLFIGFIVGLILSATGVYAATYYGTASDLSYDNTTSGLSSTNIQDALDELYNTATCPSGHYCKKYKTTPELGDYVSYTPAVTSYETDTSKTNYTETQTIYPSELNLWRVLNINEDGTIDLISEYVSSTAVYFNGQLGYQNFVGYLNELAEQYETPGITIGSRHFGYNGQTEYITDTSMFTYPAPWTSSTGAYTVESQGGGEQLYLKEYRQVYNVLGTRVAQKVGTGTPAYYWMASRDYYYDSSSRYDWRGRVVSPSGADSYNYLYNYYSSTFYERSVNNSLRPIVTLKSGLQYEGIGTEWYPMEIITS